MKKILSMILALCMVMSFMTVAFADETGCAHEWKYSEIPTSGTHTKSCDLCGTSETENCVGCQLTDGCELCGSKLLGIHPDVNNDAHCDGCENPLDHEDNIQRDKKFHWIVCSKDETKIFMKDEHAYGEWTETKAATEDAEGEKVRVCEFCKYEDKAVIDKLAHEHNYDSGGIQIIKPTCEDKGYTEKFCKCGDSQKVDFVDKLGHNYGDWTVIKEATEKAEGEKKRTCQNAGCEAFETEVIEKLAHEHKYTSNTVKPTCTEKGYTEKKCDCGDVQKSDFVDAKGHSWSEWKITKKASYTKEGEKTRSCTNDGCKEVETKKVDKIPHTCKASNKLKDKKDATCKKDGYSGDKVCEICEKVMQKGKVIKALGHDWDEKTEKCTRCKVDKSNPSTGDYIMNAVCAMSTSMAGLGVCAFVYKKKFASQGEHVEK